MSLEFKQSEFLKLSFIFSVLLFLICLQTLTFQDVFSTNNKSFEYTNESGNSSLSNSSVKKKFVNINDGDNNNTSVNQNQQIIKDGKEIELNTKVSKLIGADKVFYNNTSNLAKAIGIKEEELCFTCSTGDYSPLGITPKFRTRKEVKGEGN